MITSALVDAIKRSSETPITLKDARTALEVVMAGIELGLKEEGHVAIVGYGSFRLKTRSARPGLNPRTKEKMEIPAKTKIHFKAYATLESRLA